MGVYGSSDSGIGSSSAGMSPVSAVMPKMGLSSLAQNIPAANFPSPNIMATPKNDPHEVVTSQHLLSLMDTSPVMSSGMHTQTPYSAAVPKMESNTQSSFKHGPSKSLVQRVNILNELLNKEIMPDDCAVMQKYLANFNNHVAFRSPIKGPDSFFYCIGRNQTNVNLPSDPDQVATMMRQGLAKYIIQNRDYCEVNVIVINYLFEHKIRLKISLIFLKSMSYL